MGKNKPSEADKDVNSNQSNLDGERDRRIAALEKSLSELSSSLAERHLKTITIVFSCVTGLIALCALLVTFLGYFSKSDVQQATTRMESRMDKAASDLDSKTSKVISEMQARIDSSVDGMERKFEALSGEALKKALLTVTTPHGKLDGQTYEISGMTPFPPDPLFITNDGEKSTEPLSIRVYFSAPINASYMGGPMIAYRSADREFPIAYYLDLSGLVGRGSLSIAAKETWTFESSNLPQISPLTTNVIVCKMQFFYGADKPSDVRFTMRWK
jgi:hypothetical protein